MSKYYCPICHAKYAKCTGCKKLYEHGTKIRCPKSLCQSEAAVLECGCGATVSDDLKGVVDHNNRFREYLRRLP